MADNTEQKEPRLYARGNDQIILDDFVRSSEEGFDSFLNRIDIKDKHKGAVREAYRDMISRINSGDNTFISNLGGGFHDSTGKIKNAEIDGVDPYGIAAYYLDSVLKLLSIYTKPEAPVDPSKIKYGKDSLQNLIKSKLVGKGKGEYFLDRDIFDETTGTRTLTNRIKDLDDILVDISKNYDNYFYDFTPSQREQDLKDITSLREVLKEGVTKDEYHLLDKIVNAPWGELLSTEKTITEEQPTPSPVTLNLEKMNLGSTTIDLPTFFRFLESEGYGIPDPSALKQRLLTSDITSYNLNTENILNNIINSATTDDLNRLLFFAYKYPNENLGAHSLFADKFNGQSYSLDSNYIITKVLNNLKDRGSLVDLQNGYYYIPKLKGKNKSIIYVWDSNNNQTIGQNGLNYDWFRNELFNKFYNYDINNLTVDDYNPAYGQFFVVSQHKKGGVLKFQGGGNPTKYKTALEGIFFTDDDLKNRLMWDSSAKNWVARNVKATNQKYPGDNVYDHSDATEIENLSYWNSWKNLLNSNVNLAKAWATSYKLWRPDGITIGDDWFKTDGTFDFETFKKSTLWNDTKSGPGHDIIKGSTYQIEGVDDSNAGFYNAIPEGYEVVSNLNPTYDETGLVKIYKLQKKNSQEGPKDLTSLYLPLAMPGNSYVPSTLLKSNPISAFTKELLSPENKYKTLMGEHYYENPFKKPLYTLPKSSSVLGQGAGSYVYGTKPKDKEEKTHYDYNLIIPELVGLTRLSNSLFSNNKIADTLKKGIRPLFQNTYELFSPITGAFSEMQLRNKQGADVMSVAGRPLTSDGSQYLAHLMDAHKYNNLLQATGFLADDKEIKRTQREALARVENNVKRRSDIANATFKMINDYTNNLAQIEAAKLQKNWNSWDNFLSGAESNLKKRYETDREERRAYEQHLDLIMNAKKYLEELDEISELLAKWNTNNKTLSASDQPWYIELTQRRNELARRLNNDNLISMGKRRGWSYKDQFADNPYIRKSWKNIIV